MSTKEKERRLCRHRFIQFRDQYGAMHSLQVGRMSSNHSAVVLKHIKHLVITRKEGIVCPPITRKWLNEEGCKFVPKLIELGLVAAVPLVMQR